MKTKKFIIVNFASIIPVILIYKFISWEKILVHISPNIRSFISGSIESIILAAFYFILILALEKDKCLLSKPLLDKSQTFMKRFSIIKLVVLILLQFAHYIVTQLFYKYFVYFGASPVYIFRLIINLLHWVIVYYIIVGKGNNLFKVGKYAGAASIIVISAYVISTVINIVGEQIVAANVVSSVEFENVNIFTMLEMVNKTNRFSTYLSVMNFFDTIAEIITVSSMITFHRLSNDHVMTPAEN